MQLCGRQKYLETWRLLHALPLCLTKELVKVMEMVKLMLTKQIKLETTMGNFHSRKVQRGFILTCFLKSTVVTL